MILKEIDNFTSYSGQSPSPAAIHGNDLAPIIGSHSVEGYGDVTPIEPIPSLFRFAHIDEWAPPCSPISQNSTGSLPTTPAAQAYPDQNEVLYDRPVYSSFASDVTPEKYHSADCSRQFPSYVPNYVNYPQHQAYSSQMPVQQMCYGEKKTGSVASPSFLAGSSAAACQIPSRCNTMVREDLDFSIFMASFDPSYTL